MEELQRAAVYPMSLCRGERERNAEGEKKKKTQRGCKRKGCFRRDGKRGKEGRGLEMGKEGGREGEIVTPRRRVQRQGNERLPALHHAQGLPQSAGGRGKMPHVSGLLALPLVCMHLGLCVSVCVSSGCMCVCVFENKMREEKRNMQSESLQNFKLSSQKKGAFSERGRY